MPIPSSPQALFPDERLLCCAAFVRGEAEPAGEDNDAALLLRFYNTFLADVNEYDVTQAALNSLATLRGNFAFVLYDAGGARVPLAAFAPKSWHKPRIAIPLADCQLPGSSRHPHAQCSYLRCRERSPAPPAWSGVCCSCASVHVPPS